MCGRYVLYGPMTRLEKDFMLRESPLIDPRYNIPPQTNILVIRQKPNVGRVGQLVRWGLVPNWAKDTSIGAKLNNARAEGIADKPSFRSSFARHRCLIPANAFYEWKAVSEKGKVKKQPYCIRPKDNEAFLAFAGLLARWRSPEGNDLITACIITTGPNEVMAPIHDRMPVILAPENWDTWLDGENRNRESLERLLRPAKPEGLVAYPVSTAVSRAGNEGSELIQPLPDAEGFANDAQ